MRCYQHVGLTSEAEAFLSENVATEPNLICPHCSEVITTKKVVISSEEYDAFYGDGPTLPTYRLKNGEAIKEVVQAMPWSSGPMGFLCLENSKGEEMFQWTEKEIEEESE
jgi:hypothetical protein